MPSTFSTTTASSNLFHHVVSGSIQDRIWMLQMAQREHTLTKPPTNGIALVLPEPLQDYFYDREYEDDEASTKPSNLHRDYSEKATVQHGPIGAKKTSVLCILPQWPGYFLRKRKRGASTMKITDSSTVRLLDESSGHGEWS